INKIKDKIKHCKKSKNQYYNYTKIGVIYYSIVLGFKKIPRIFSVNIKSLDKDGLDAILILPIPYGGYVEPEPEYVIWCTRNEIKDKLKNITIDKKLKWIF
ncbi:MAG: hypothetical protein HY515_03340, partial [Candidatus Aenigmarchaeota archaeon]|nr:hypothetical protein [Candidatus Aenigmarchaeota archaeon]